MTRPFQASPALWEAWNRFLPRIFSGSTLKLVAILTMTIDHFTAGVIYFQLVTHQIPPWTDFNGLYQAYLVLRGVGRTAFPIYCFLLVEGLMHTRSRWQYLVSLLSFALLSELPFDLALTPEISDPYSVDILRLLREDHGAMLEHQNVFFTLAIGLTACWIIEGFRERHGVCPLTILAALPTAWLAIRGAEALNTDYHGVGVGLILVLYLLYPIRAAAATLGYLTITRLDLEEWGFPAFLLMLCYNGKRGFLGRRRSVKYFFYLFYPLHLIIIFLLRPLLL